MRLPENTLVTYIKQGRKRFFIEAICVVFSRYISIGMPIQTGHAYYHIMLDLISYDLMTNNPVIGLYWLHFISFWMKSNL